MKYLKIAVSMLAIPFLSGCTLLNPQSLTDPVATPEAAFKYSLGGTITDADGNEQAVDYDSVAVRQEALKDNWSIGMDRKYYDTTQMPREGMKNFAEVLKVHAETGNAPTAEQLYLYAGTIETLANYDIPLILESEKVDVQRSNDPEAFATARVAQFQSAADLAKYQTDAVSDGAELLTPYGAASGAFDSLLGSLQSPGSSSPPPAEPITVPSGS